MQLKLMLKRINVIYELLFKCKKNIKNCWKVCQILRNWQIWNEVLMMQEKQLELLKEQEVYSHYQLNWDQLKQVEMMIDLLISLIEHKVYQKKLILLFMKMCWMIVIQLVNDLLIVYLMKLHHLIYQEINMIDH